MINLTIRSLPLQTVLQDLADKIGSTLEEDCRVYSVRIPDAFGSGKITGINFLSGLGVIFYNCIFKNDSALSFTEDAVHPLKFLYCLEGEIRHRLTSDLEYKQVNRLQSVIVASQLNGGHTLEFKKGNQIKLCSLEIDRAIFAKSSLVSKGQIHPKLYEILIDINAQNSFYHQGDFSLKMYDTLSEIYDNDDVGILRLLYIQSVAAQLTFLQLAQFEEELNRTPAQLALRKNEIETIKQVASSLRKDLSQPKNIEGLAQEVGTNSNKLQTGFKILYGTTINGFIKEERLTKANFLLANTDLSITEVVREIGLVNRGYFAKQFSEKYGLTPQEFKLKNKKSLAI